MPTRKKRIKQAAIVEAFAERLREVRTARAMTQKALADQAHVTLSYVSKLESGGAAPGLDLLERLATALEVNIPDLLPKPAPTEPKSRSKLKERFEAVVERAGDESLVMLSLLLELLDVSPALGR